MQLSKNRASVAIATAATSVMFLLSAGTAFAGTGLGVTPNFPTPVTVGDTSVAVSLVVTNNSTADEGNVTVSNITLIPSCGNSTITCTSPDPGVFAVSAAGTGQAATSCAGDNFTIAEIDAGTGKVAFTRTGGPLTLAFGASCQINFTVNVLKSPTVDASGAAGNQTVQRGAADGLSSLQNPADGTGADTTTVNKASPGIQTTPSAGGPVGTVLNDTATVSGGVSPTGSVTFKLFPPSDASCSGAASYTDTDPSAAYATNPGFASNAAGVWHWTAVYNGDANNNAATSTCELETATITKASPGIQTTPTPASGPVGTVLNDTASVTGGASPTGNVTFKLFPPADATCAGVPVYSEVDPSAPYATSPGYASLVVGTYRWTADYAGDANNNPVSSGCQDEQVTISKVSPTISTVPTPASGPVGTVLNDTASLSGGSSPTGDVTFKLFPPSDATCAGVPVFTSTDSLAPYSTSLGYVSNVVGTYRWTADYAGDANNNPVSSGCQDEQVVISKVTPSISTTPTPANGSVGTVLNDTATLTGGSAPTGNVTFKLFPPADATCSGVPVYTEVDGSAPYATSPGYASLVAGTYRWTADYAGDANNNPASSGCQDEQVVIEQLAVQGCSPGYWKQSQHFGSYPTGSGIYPNTLFVTVFGEDAFPGMSLLQVLNQGGGGLNALGRHLVGGWLNSSTINGFNPTPAQIVASFQAVFPGGDYSTLSSQLEALEDPCPLGLNPGPAYAGGPVEKPGKGPKK